MKTYFLWNFVVAVISLPQNISTCLETLPTIAYVQNCPFSKAEWLKRVEEKQCGTIKQSCTKSEDDFDYHCLINEWANATLEVCAPVRQIIGSCAEFSHGRKSIQDSLIKCKKCPQSYRSTEAYKFTECYVYAHRRQVTLQLSDVDDKISISADYYGSFRISHILLGLILFLLTMIVFGLVYHLYLYKKCSEKKALRHVNTEEPLIRIEDVQTDEIQQGAIIIERILD